MIPYFFMVLTPAVVSAYLSWKKYDSKRRFQITIDCFFVIWLFLLCFRSESVGVDLTVYKYHFSNYSMISWETIIKRIINDEIESGFFVLIKLISLFTVSFRWVIVTCAIVSVIPIWKMYRDENGFGFLTVVMFLNVAPFVMYFSGLRQCLSMAFVNPCYKSCKEHNWKKFLLFVFLAYLFHRSSLILLFMYPIYHLRFKKRKYILLLLPLIAGVYVFNVPIFGFLVVFLHSDFYEMYASSIRSNGAYAVLLLLAVMLIYTYLIPDQEKLDDDMVGLRNLMTFSVFLQVFAGVHTIAMRMNYFYLLLIPILMNRIVQIGEPKYKNIVKISRICMVLFFTLYYFYYAYTDSDILQVYPYKSMFF